MGRKFHHLTYSDRLKIEALHMAKHTSQEIADQLGVHVSTINRELKRGVYMTLMAFIKEMSWNTSLSSI